MAETIELKAIKTTKMDTGLGHSDAEQSINEAVLKPYIEKVVYSTLKNILESSTPENQLVLLLYTQIRDTEAFKLELNARLTRLEQDVAVLKEDVAVLKEDVAVLKEDVAVLKEDVAVLKEDVAVLKEDVAVLKEDMAFVKSSMVTKDYWEEEKLRLLQGIGKEVRKVIQEYFDRPSISDK